MAKALRHAQDRLATRQALFNESNKKKIDPGANKPGSMNRRKGTGKRALHGTRNLKQISATAVAGGGGLKHR